MTGIAPTLAGRVALVSGGSRGIGAAVAIALARRGAAVAILYRRDTEAATLIAKQVDDFGGVLRAYRARVDDRAAVEDAVTSFSGEFGPIDILVSNAGQASRGNDVVSTEPSEVESLFQVHALGAFHLCQLVLPGMRNRPRSDIVMVSSVATVTWPAGSAPYSMAKAALEALAKTLVKEETRRGVRVNVVAPAMTDTDMGSRAARGRYGVATMRDLDQRAPFGSVCPPEAVADVVCFLVSDAGAHVIDQRIALDGNGGWS